MVEVTIANGNEVIKTIETVTSKMFIITPDKDGLKTIFTTDRMSINDEYSIDQSYLKTIRQLQKIYPNQLSHLKPERFLVVVDDKFSGPTKATKKEPWKTQLNT